MAFVFRSQTQHRPNPSPAPGQYHCPPKNNPTLATVPFNQSSPRNIWRKNAIPGPGAYEAEQQKSNCKAIIKNCGNSYAIMEAPIESSNFKSASKRFHLSEEPNPGPGQYSISLEKPVKERNATQPNSLVKYLQKSRVHNDKDKEVGLLAIGEENPANNRDSISQSCHIKKNEKKHIPFQSLAERNKPIRPQTSLGPGSYELTQAKQEKQQANRLKNSQSLAKFKKVVPEGHEEEMEIGIRKEQESRVGKKSFNQRNHDFFGSSVSRFTNAFKTKTPGPGQYEYQSGKSKSHCTLPAKKAAFGRSSNQVQMRDIFVSPFMKPDNKAQRPKKNDKKKPSIACFVFKEPRFKETKTISSSEGHLLASNHLFLGKENSDKPNEMKKSSTKFTPKLLIKKGPIKKEQADPRPLSYATDAYTISAKNKEKTQINAPFMSCANRFNEATNSVSAEFQAAYNQSSVLTEIKEREISGRGVSPKGIMDSKNPRFDYREGQNQLSPFSYNPAKPSGKEFNKLFL